MEKKSRETRKREKNSKNPKLFYIIIIKYGEIYKLIE